MILIDCPDLFRVRVHILMKLSLHFLPLSELFIVVVWLQIKTVIFLVILYRNKRSIKDEKIQEINFVLHLVGGILYWTFTIILRISPFLMVFICISGKVAKKKKKNNCYVQSVCSLYLWVLLIELHNCVSSITINLLKLWKYWLGHVF